jgi:hypothetical protein
VAGLKSLTSLLVIVGVCALAGTSFAKTAPKPKCGFNGDYSFFFWDPAGFSEGDLSGVGFFSVQLDPNTKCRSGVVLPGGIINCNFTGDDIVKSVSIFEDFIEGGSVFLESDGEGTMEIETNSSSGICDTGKNALELDISVVSGGKSVLFNTNGAELVRSGTTPNAGYDFTLTGRADKCFAGQISGCYDIRFWTSFIEPFVGDCTICVNGAGAVTGGTCRCSTNIIRSVSFETLSEIEGGGYTLGEDCQSSTGYLWIATSSDKICDFGSFMAFDFAVAQQGKEIIGACDTAFSILNNPSEFNVGVFGCAFEGWLQ